MKSKYEKVERINSSIRCANLHIKRANKRIAELMKQKNRIMGKR